MLLHDDQQIAFQCVTPATLDFDGVPYECLSTSLDWFSPPTVVTNRATGNIILNADKMKTAHARWTLEDLNSPIPVEQLIIQPPIPRLSDKISETFMEYLLNTCLVFLTNESKYSFLKLLHNFPP